MTLIMKRLLLAITISLYAISAYSQFGGDNVYSFVNTSNSAKIAALGNNTISLKNNDVSFFTLNPSLIDSLYKNETAMTWGSYFFSEAGVFSGSIFSSFTIKGQQIGFGIKALNYGPFRAKDEANNDLGLELATDEVLYVGWAYHFLDKYSVGANVKPVYSYIAGYSSFGILFDLGATMVDSAKNITVSAVIRNFGSQIKPYTVKNYEPLPFEILIGATKQLEHAPFRFSVTYRNLQKFNLRYPEKKEKDIINLSDNDTEEQGWKVFGDKALRHFIVGTELLISKNIYAAVSYDFRKRQELSLDNRKGAVGFSYGFGVRIAKFRFEYGRSSYSLAGTTNLITINANINDFIK